MQNTQQALPKKAHQIDKSTVGEGKYIRGRWGYVGTHRKIGGQKENASF
jgi:hypothetical protein